MKGGIMEIIKNSNFDLNTYDHDFFLQEILSIYGEADNNVKVQLLQLLWTIRLDKQSEQNRKENKEMLDTLKKTLVATI